MTLAPSPPVVVTRETYASIVRDIAPMLDAHWQELAMFKDEIPLDVNWEAYNRGYDAGLLRAYGVRAGGTLIGYAVFQVVPRHAHYAHRWAINDVIWIHPNFRNFGVGSKLCEAYERDLADGGPIVVVVETKAHSPALAALLAAKQYLLMGSVFAKRIG